MDAIRLREQREQALAVLTFDAPSRRNALDRATRMELVDRLRLLDEDPGVRVVVLTGTDPAFTSGVDAKELLADPGYAAPPLDPPAALRAMATPTIAAVNGSCVTGGLEIALGCSFVVASDRATFADTHARLGLSPGWGMSVELPAAVGVRRARQLTLTGEPIGAATALTWGLVNEVVAHERLLDRCRELGSAIADASEGDVRHALGLYREGAEGALAAGRLREREALAAWSVDRDAAWARFRR